MWRGRACSLDEQPDGAVLQGILAIRATFCGDRERRYRVNPLALCPKRLAAGGDHPRCRVGAQQRLGHPRRRVDHMLAIVEHQHELLRAKQLMLVLDNCEHVVDAAARMAEALLRANPAARVIATSREPLRAEGERVYPVPPLAVPTESSPDSEDPLQYGAVRLFVERARAAAPHFSSDARAAAGIAGICRRLDGIPLAIELAAARAAALGIDGLAARLDDRFRLLAGGYRTTMPRHQTLRATLDWSYELLTEPERVVLCRLASFAAR